jgi:hypothetical protein
VHRLPQVSGLRQCVARGVTSDRGLKVEAPVAACAQREHARQAAERGFERRGEPGPDAYNVPKPRARTGGLLLAERNNLGATSVVAQHFERMPTARRSGEANLELVVPSPVCKRSALQCCPEAKPRVELLIALPRA